MVERNLAKVEVAGPSPVFRSNKRDEIWKTLGQSSLRDYLWNEWRHCCHERYWKKRPEFFEEWYGSITDVQRMYFTAYMEGKKTPFNDG